MKIELECQMCKGRNSKLVTDNFVQGGKCVALDTNRNQMSKVRVNTNLKNKKMTE